MFLRTLHVFFLASVTSTLSCVGHNSIVRRAWTSSSLWKDGWMARHQRTPYPATSWSIWFKLSCFFQPIFLKQNATTMDTFSILSSQLHLCWTIINQKAWQQIWMGHVDRGEMKIDLMLPWTFQTFSCRSMSVEYYLFTNINQGKFPGFFLEKNHDYFVALFFL